MDANEDPHVDVEFELLDEAGVQEAVDNALALAGCTWDELQAQAKAGSFTSEVARTVWFAVSSLVEPSSA